MHTCPPTVLSVALDVHRSKPPKKGEALFIEKLFRSQSTPHFAKPICVFSPQFPLNNLSFSNPHSTLQCIIYSASRPQYYVQTYSFKCAWCKTSFRVRKEAGVVLPEHQEHKQPRQLEIREILKDLFAREKFLGCKAKNSQKRISGRQQRGREALTT